MNRYAKTHVSEGARTELHDLLGLTGAEISINTLPAGESVPFVHAHKRNEEIYAVLSGTGTAVIDGETVALAAGDWLRVDPIAQRRLFASAGGALKYVCIQVKAGSLADYTMTDAVVM